VSDPASLRDRAVELFRRVQDEITTRLEAIDGQAKFREDVWERPGGGGGRTRVIEDGAVFEKGGVNTSVVFGELPEAMAKERGPKDDYSFFATGVSLVIHPRSPMVPTVHLNYRYLERAAADHPDRVAWFGGGADLTPYYLIEDDARLFHRELKAACDRHESADYEAFKSWCDRYFFIPHRDEPRGVGGIFFDHLGADAKHPSELEAIFQFVGDVSGAFLRTYPGIALRNKDLAYGDAERRWQLQRRGRYVEFNLVYDRGTAFGLKTRGRIESILMSLPPLTRWDYDVHAAPGSREAALLEGLMPPRDWAARE
jgi:coproporphyrinogen III oxidase